MAKDSYYDTYEMKFVDEIEYDSDNERYIKMPRYDGVVSFKIKPTYEELEKALDKACDELESLDYKLKMKEALTCSYDCDYIHAEEWKKELLK